MPIRKIVIRDSSGAQRQVAVDDNRFRVLDASIRQSALAHDIAAHYSGRANDAGEAIGFVVSQLAHTENETFERMRTPMQYEKLIPISFEAGEHATSIRYEIYDWTGKGKRHSGRGQDIPTVDVAWGQKSMDVVSGAIGYEYTQEELRQSAFLKKPLDSRRLGAALDGQHRHLNDVGLNGETESNFTGLYNNALVPTGNAPTGAWMTPATPANILKDINTGIIAVWTASGYNDQVTDVIMPPSVYAYIAQTPRSDNSDKTILQFIKENNIAKTEKGIDINFQPGYALETAGAGSTKRVVFYVKNPQRLIMHVPMPLRFLAPQMVGLSVKVPGEYKYSGVEVRYPKSMYYMDGV